MSPPFASLHKIKRKGSRLMRLAAVAEAAGGRQDTKLHTFTGYEAALLRRHKTARRGAVASKRVMPFAL